MMTTSPSACIQLKEGTHIAKTVLMPGDPLRAKYIAEHYLENPVLFNDVRSMFGYTGTYKGKEVSVMGSGMGVPSMGLYVHELFNFFGVEAVIRVGSAGALQENVKVYKLLEVDLDKKIFTFTNEFPILVAGNPYVIVVEKGSLNLSAKNVTIVPTPKEPQAVKTINGTKDVGWWAGTFKRMDNNEMLKEKAYIIQSNGTFRCSAEKYSYMYIYPFRGYFSASEPLDSEIYKMKFIQTENGEETGEETDFPADEFYSDCDIDDATGIDTMSDVRSKMEEVYYDLQGRKLSGKPNKGIYIQNGKKIIIK